MIKELFTLNQLNIDYNLNTFPESNEHYEFLTEPQKKDLFLLLKSIIVKCGKIGDIFYKQKTIVPNCHIFFFQPLFNCCVMRFNT